MATEEFYSLKAKARFAGITRSEYIRRCIATSIVRQRLSPELMNHLRQLSGMANNVNQIAHKANAMGYARVYQDNEGTGRLAPLVQLDGICTSLSRQPCDD